MAKVKQPRVPSVRMATDHKVQADRRTTGSVRAVGSKPAAQFNGLLPHNDQTMVVGSVLRKVVDHHVPTTAVVPRRAAAVLAQAAVVRSSAVAQVVVVLLVAAVALAVAPHVVVAPVAVSNNALVVGRNVPVVGHSVRVVPVATGVPVDRAAVVHRMGKTGMAHLAIVAGRVARSVVQRHKRCVCRYVRAARSSCRR